LFAYDESKDIYVTQKAKDLAAEKAQESQSVSNFGGDKSADSGFNL